MDITLQDKGKKFQYKVVALIIRQDKLLIMCEAEHQIWFLPGGKVQIGETAQKALLREMQEELKIDIQILRPLWLHQNYFLDYESGIPCHEICLYFLVKTRMDFATSRFSTEENGCLHLFEWVDFSELENRNIYPRFLRQAIYHFPDHLQLITENLKA